MSRSSAACPSSVARTLGVVWSTTVQINSPARQWTWDPGISSRLPAIGSALNLLGLRYLHPGSERNHSRAILKTKSPAEQVCRISHCTLFCTLRGVAYLAPDGEAFSMMPGCLQAIAWSWVLRLRTPEIRSCSWSTILTEDSSLKLSLIVGALS